MLVASSIVSRDEVLAKLKYFSRKIQTSRQCDPYFRGMHWHCSGGCVTGNLLRYGLQLFFFTNFHLMHLLETRSEALHVGIYGWMPTYLIYLHTGAQEEL